MSRTLARLLATTAVATAQITPEEIAEIGKAIYDAVEDNQPVINVATDWAGAVPKGIDDWTVLENWHEPTKSQQFKVEFKNGLGMKLTEFEWSFAWKYGGDYNGVGQYVTQAGIQVAEAYAYLSEHLDVKVQSLKPVNYGTRSSPIGGLDVQVSVTSHGHFEKTTKSCTMTVKGDGSSVLGTCESGTFGVAPAKIQVEVLSEAGCEPCQWSIMHYYWPLFKQLADVIEVDHHPFGNNYFATEACGGTDDVYNSTERQCWARRCVGTYDTHVVDPPGDCFTGSIVQQHGAPEASVDRMEACAKSLALDWTEYWTFMSCMEQQYLHDYFSFHTVEDATQGCLNGTQLEYTQLSVCYNGTAGDTAVRREANATFDHEGVPLVYVNRKVVSPSNYQHSILLGAICAELSEPKPEVCNAPTYPCWSDVSGGCKSSLLV